MPSLCQSFPLACLFSGENDIGIGLIQSKACAILVRTVERGKEALNLLTSPAKLIREMPGIHLKDFDRQCLDDGLPHITRVMVSLETLISGSVSPSTRLKGCL